MRDEAGKSTLAERLGVFGDLPTRLMHMALRVLPWFLEPVLIGSWTLLFLMTGTAQRRAVVGNLRALHPQWSGWRAQLGAWQVFWNFARTYVDAQRCETATGGVDWAVEGLAAFEDLASRKDGCIILTAHMGNYDLAAPLFAARFQRTLFTVRAPERTPETQRVRELEIEKKQAAYPNFRSLVNDDGNLLGIQLASLLREGHIVAVQGDRVLFDVSPMEVEVRPGLWMRLPKGPLFLARATQAPCFPLVITRDGWRSYRVTVQRPLDLPARRRGDEAEVAKVWAKAVFEMAAKHWDQWYVFEPLLTRKSVELVGGKSLGGA